MKSNVFSLDGTVALITGAGSGIGRATAKMLAAFGARVAVTELPGRTSLAESLVSELAASGTEAMAVSLDVRATLTIESAVHQVVKRFGTLDVLINNAGTQLLKPALELDEEEFDEVMAINLKGPFLCCQSAGAFMAQQRRGCIINVASQHGVVGNHLRAAYCASKGGLVNLTRALAVEWAQYNIRVNAISPTFVSHEANRALIEAPEMQEQIELGTPLKMPATPEDVAAGICYLVSPAARMVTGHNLMIDGGWTAR